MIIFLILGQTKVDIHLTEHDQTEGGSTLTLGDLSSQVHSLTQVPVENQKLIYKGRYSTFWFVCMIVSCILFLVRKNFSFACINYSWKNAPFERYHDKKYLLDILLQAHTMYSSQSTCIHSFKCVHEL